MNICTYVSVVNMNPKIYIIAIDYKSLTYSNLMNNSSNLLLQILGKDNIRIIRNLGKKSGFNFNKMNFLMNKNLTEKWKDIDYLKGVSSLLELKNVKKITEFPDHALFSFELNSYKSINDKILTFNHLIDNKIIL